jgi:protein transport protein SEC61 subunit gamma-like protein
MLRAASMLTVASAEFSKIALATVIGFAIMGLIGFFVKLVFIPINQIL